MSSRITRAQLDEMVIEINDLVARKKKLDPRYQLTSWAPGDGWKRYRLTNFQGYNMSNVCSAREMHEVLYSLILLLRHL